MTKIERATAYLNIQDAQTNQADLPTEPSAASRRRLVASLVLNRPDRANAFNAQMLDDLCELISLASHYEDLSLLAVYGAGKHFSAGADLNWMKEAKTLSYQENFEDAKRLTQLMEALQQFPSPTLAVVKGSAYGGGLGLIAACDFALAASDAKFCLSEAKLGLMPAVILPYLGRKLPLGDLSRLALSAQVFQAETAMRLGLVQLICAPGQLEASLRAELAALLQAGPYAQKKLKRLIATLQPRAFAQSDITAEGIARIRVGEEAQNGLAAFFEKQTPEYCVASTDGLNFDDL